MSDHTDDSVLRDMLEQEDAEYVVTRREWDQSLGCYVYHHHLLDTRSFKRLWMYLVLHDPRHNYDYIRRWLRR